ncbi:MAG TPA: sulfate adenylyltransferase [Terriglobales bacterium]|nr:sulfate adenylyltransferase [Terriglobales bacterium]
MTARASAPRAAGQPVNGQARYRGVPPHGGRLVNRVLEGTARERYERRAASLPKIGLNQRQRSDVELIGIGAFSPLEGFMGQADYRNVLQHERLASGLPWTIPVTLALTQEQAKQVRHASEVALTDAEGETVAVLHVNEVFRYDREQEAKAVLLTTSDAHPGVRYLESVGEYCVAGPISVLRRLDHGVFSDYLLDPVETRYLFEHRQWSRIVAFQTRNPVHRAHEYILKCALETVDGLLLHPLVGATREEDIPAEVRLRCYLALIGRALPAQRCVMSVYPAAMRYAGPREAIFHGIARKNYGCTHFVVGRDHAGVGNFYGPYDAQKKFTQFDPAALGITPICFDATFHCKKCGGVASEKTCPHSMDDRLILSGTKVRELLSSGQDLPVEFTRPEIADLLREAYQNGVKN